MTIDQPFPLKLSKNGAKKYQLIEIPLDLLKQIEDNEDIQLNIQGNEEDEPILISENKSYKIKQSLTSNSLIICKKSHSEYLGLETLGEYLNLTEFKPDFSKIKALLLDSVYKEIDTGNRIVNLLTFNDILSKCQGSPLEINAELDDLYSFEHNGYIQLIDLNLIYNTLEIIITASSAFSFSLDSVNKEKLKEGIKDLDFSSIVMNYCFNKFFQKIQNQECWSLNKGALSKFLGMYLLKLKKENYYSIQEFIQTWKTKLLVDIEVDLKTINGYYYIKKHLGQTQIIYLSKKDLVYDPKSRLNYLFKLKLEWEFEELKPFIQDYFLNPKDHEMHSFLLKFCIFVKLNNSKIPFYKAKYNF